MNASDRLRLVGKLIGEPHRCLLRHALMISRHHVHDWAMTPASERNEDGRNGTTIGTPARSSGGEPIEIGSNWLDL